MADPLGTKKWLFAANLADCPVGGCLETVVDGRIVAIFHTEEGIFALDGVCPHQGGPLGKGRLVGCSVTCPWHGWQFDVRTGGHLLNPRIIQAAIDVRLENDQILVDVSDSSAT